MAIGVVTAFGAIDSATARDPWSSHTSPIPLTMDVVDPATSATLMPLRLSVHGGGFELGDFARKRGADSAHRDMHCGLRQNGHQAVVPQGPCLDGAVIRQ